MAEVNKYILFKLKNQTFGVEVSQVISIERLQEITGVPRTSEFIKGVTYIREQTTPIIDLRERLLMDEAKPTDDTRILVVSINSMQLGLIVDAATEVKDIDQSVIDPAPEIIGGVKETFIRGVARLENGLLILLELESIIDPYETNELLEVVSE
ncbi:chemotaxis protein CheW [Oceanobacillus sp. 143]|uniref:Chemotaxis protein CheW n=1 Tax=Oceanobacillus zhaokaii TaxID=2052660 RepID=A0A345PJ65_9BACI|nr:chemotaxis protein CheW [Oceanobacillus zhaokaii]AXI10045.1 chemotaxis protein CheW [Oceanobacillus zhaokaii]QGS69190.1 chemotaxis protein CheW [Oceanobacillus sp. 143]